MQTAGTASCSAGHIRLMQQPRPTEPAIVALHATSVLQRQQHDWSQCFFAHPQERARRRSLQKYSYAAVLCPDMVNSGSCRHGDACDKSHSVGSTACTVAGDLYRSRSCHALFFSRQWLHPAVLTNCEAAHSSTRSICQRLAIHSSLSMLGRN
jgi:hypothetical protein